LPLLALLGLLLFWARPARACGGIPTSFCGWMNCPTVL